jgi:hypothetical protein
LDRTVYGGSEVGTTLTNDNILAGARAYLWARATWKKAFHTIHKNDKRRKWCVYLLSQLLVVVLLLVIAVVIIGIAIQ